ncbi:FadR/GntR family transcriptional regulator [Curtobacterium sp. Leaf261]|uniref:FadR/GntR family transcriptional regulator n=1 Tax=Curtobacterium sp. Leaf261 TaxID=1736311 RepID=UPI0007017C26|nr:FCD domain-containing protein [Curtobacterium sp. Leaf261]KQO62116.1 hypothetical protein ASF23_09750 [Curtobacterium sp. Leaf261]
MTVGTRTAVSAFDRVLDDIGTAIVRSELPAGHRDTVEGLERRTGTSRSIVREAIRVLTALGMLSAGRRVGLRVLPRDSWNVLDPLVIHWRLASADRPAQLEELRALRLAVEPEAARLAAERIDREGRIALAGTAHDLDAAGTERAWADADRALHGLVLRLSGNAMFIRLESVVDAALHERESLPVDPHALAQHRGVATAIGAGDGDRAASLMRRIVADTHA